MKIKVPRLNLWVIVYVLDGFIKLFHVSSVFPFRYPVWMEGFQIYRCFNHSQKKEWLRNAILKPQATQSQPVGMDMYRTDKRKGEKYKITDRIRFYCLKAIHFSTGKSAFQSARCLFPAPVSHLSDIIKLWLSRIRGSKWEFPVWMGRFLE